MLAAWAETPATTLKFASPQPFCAADPLAWRSAIASHPTTARTAASHPRLIVRALLVVWAVLGFAIITSLTAAHTYALPKPTRQNAQLASAVAGLREPSESGWLAVHALVSHCKCSQRILAHLLQRAAIRGVHEHVVWIGSQPEREAELARAGFRVHTVSPLALKRDFGAVAVPLFIVAARGGELHYVGGYTTHAQGADIRDVAILGQVRASRALEDLPIFGCAVSRSLQKLLDPFALKY